MEWNAEHISCLFLRCAEPLRRMAQGVRGWHNLFRPFPHRMYRDRTKACKRSREDVMRLGFVTCVCCIFNPGM